MAHGARLCVHFSRVKQVLREGALQPVGTRVQIQEPRWIELGFGGWGCSCLPSNVADTPDLQETESQESPVVPVLFIFILCGRW